MIIIFAFSSQNGEQSSRVSQSFLKYIMNHFIQIMPANLWSFLENYIRKVAHFTIYGFLGIFAALASKEYKENDSKRLKKWMLFAVPWGIAVCYAITDEFHQYFVPGRACMFRDVCIDSMGAAVGIAVVLLISCLKKKKTIST